MTQPVILHWQVVPCSHAFSSGPMTRNPECVRWPATFMGDSNDGGISIRRYIEALPILLRLLETDPEAEVRGAAAAALGFHADLKTIPNLRRAAADPSEEVRYHVAFSVGSFYGCDWTEADALYKAEAQEILLRLMDDPDEDVRDWATFGIHQGEHDTPEARASLWKALDDPNADVRGEAAEGLALFGDQSFIPRLDSLLREDADPSPLYFVAAKEFADPVLSSAVEIGAERWRAMQDREMHPYVLSALEALRTVSSD
jgi:hypothetical protein